MEIRALYNLGDVSNEQVSVLFTGGSDSTLAAYLMCEMFKKVHLLTFLISAMGNLDRCQIHVKRLQDRFGKRNVIHTYIDIEKLLKKTFYGTYIYDIRKYKTYLSALFCAACNISMHTRTIIYNKKNEIRFACDGQQADTRLVTTEKKIENLRPLWSEQIQKVLELVKNFYKNYDINYFNPVYNIERTDWELFKRGFLKERDLKTKGRITQESNHHTFEKKTEHTCTGQVIGMHYLIHYFFPIHGWKKHEKLSFRYYEEKMKVNSRYIKRHLEN
ncbi:MAG: hypothetical protein ACFFCQ_18005 [Promethearchaeota archaeon]